MTDSTANPLSAAQVKAARALLGWNQLELSNRAKIAVSTVADFERGKRTPVPNNLEAIRAAFQSAGVTFLPGGAVAGPRSASTVQPALSAAGKPFRLIDGKDLSQWAERLDAKGLFPELISRLILASTGNSVKRLRFRASDSTQLEGWDGVCEQYVSKDLPWLPVAASGWELSTQRDAIRSKAESDYKKRTSAPIELRPEESTFVFATLKSWPKGVEWAAAKRGQKTWSDVRLVDADDLVHWIELFPAVGFWLASKLNKLPNSVAPLADVWQEWRVATEWPLTPEIVLGGRDDEAIDLLNWLRSVPSVRSVQADSPDTAIGFLYAAITLLPEPDRTFYLMRSVKLSNADAARTLCNSPSPLIIIMETSEPGLATRLAQQGHHVFLAYGSAVGIPEINTVLSRPTYDVFHNALEEAGIPELRRQQLARDSVRSVAILRRLIPSTTITIPDWASGERARQLIPLMLAGGWDQSREADQEALEKLAKEPFASIEPRFAQFADGPDAPLRHAGSAWKIASPRDAWFRLGRFITKGDLDRFTELALSVLKTSDPRFAMNPDERWLAGIRQQLPLHSPWLIAGLTETLLLLAMFGKQVTTVNNAESFPAAIVRSLLSDADAERWWSLSHHLRPLAEAAPDAFLDALEKSLARDDRPVMALFQEDKGPLWGSAHHSDLLWALETLAWSPQYLSRASELLAELALLDPGGKWANRPKNSLRTIFLLWKPQTNANLSERLQVLDHLRRKQPNAAWQLMLHILPTGYDTMSPTPQPRWRDFAVPESEEVTYRLIAEGAEALSARLITDAGTAPSRWVELIEALPSFAPEFRKKAISALNELALPFSDDSLRSPIWGALRNLLSRHRSFPDAGWALPSQELDEIENVYCRFTPADLVEQRVWLFSDNVPLVTGQQGDDWKARDEEIMAKRREAVSEIAPKGLPLIQQLIARAQRPFWVGIAFGQQAPSSENVEQVVETIPAIDETRNREFLHGAVVAAHCRFGNSWSRDLLAGPRIRNWTPERVLQVLLALPSEQATWNLVESFGDPIRTDYWRAANFWPTKNDEDVLFALQRLLEVGRARDAVHAVANKPDRLPANLVLEMLYKAIQTPPSHSDHNEPVMFQWSVCQLLRRLDADQNVAQDEIAKLEWAYLPLLEHSERPPVVLHSLMSREPAFFVQVLSAIFRAHSDSNTEKVDLSEETKALASQAFRLMESWSLVPGTSDGKTDPVRLHAWVKEAHRLCVLAERGAVGDTYIGRILAFANAEQNGIWPEKAVRDVIEELKNDHVENGIISGIHNKRGVTSRGMFDGGSIERGIAAQYRAWADAVKFEWPRTGALLERIALSFEDSATVHDDDAEFTDWAY